MLFNVFFILFINVFFNFPCCASEVIEYKKGCYSSSTLKKITGWEGTASYSANDGDLKDPYGLSWNWKDWEVQQRVKILLEKKSKTESVDLFNLANEEFITLVGPFIVDKRVFLGSGDEGAVYIALHKPSNHLVAAKLGSLRQNTENLRKLNRLYGFYSRDKTSYVFMPLGIGRGLEEYSSNLYFAVMDEQDKFQLKLNLLEAFINEVEYLTHSRVFYEEPDPDHFIVVEDNELRLKVLSIDHSSKNSPDFTDHYLSNLSSFIDIIKNIFAVDENIENFAQQNAKFLRKLNELNQAIANGNDISRKFIKLCRSYHSRMLLTVEKKGYPQAHNSSDFQHDFESISIALSDPYKLCWNWQDDKVKDKVMQMIQRKAQVGYSNLFTTSCKQLLVTKGDFVIDKRAILEVNPQGVLYTALHRPSNCLVAAKFSTERQNTTNLYKLKRLYDVSWETYDQSYTFMPLQTGKTINQYSDELFFNPISLKDKFRLKSELVKAYFQEIEYLQSRGVFPHPEYFRVLDNKPFQPNVYVTNTYPLDHPEYTGDYLTTGHINIVKGIFEFNEEEKLNSNFMKFNNAFLHSLKIFEKKVRNNETVFLKDLSFLYEQYVSKIVSLIK